MALKLFSVYQRGLLKRLTRNPKYDLYMVTSWELNPVQTILGETGSTGTIDTYWEMEFSIYLMQTLLA